MRTKLIFILVLLFFITGCWNYKELTSLSIVENIAIDYNDEKDEYNITFQVINIESDTKYTIYNKSAKTISEAIKNINETESKEIYTGYTSTVLISEKVAKSKIDNIIEFLIRDLEINKGASLMLVKDNMASASLTVEDLQELMQINAYNIGTIAKESYDVFISQFISNTTEAVLPVIEIDENKEPQIFGLAYFKGKTFGGYLTEEESLIYNILKEKVKNTIYTFSCNKKNYGSIEISNINTLSKIEIIKALPKNKINITFDATISELGCSMDSKAFIKLAENQMRNQVSEAINQFIKEYKIDILGFEDYLYKNEYSYWNKTKWTEIFDKIESSVDVEINLLGKGALKSDTKEVLDD